MLKEKEDLLTRRMILAVVGMACFWPFVTITSQLDRWLANTHTLENSLSDWGVLFYSAVLLIIFGLSAIYSQKVQRLITPKLPVVLVGGCIGSFSVFLIFANSWLFHNTFIVNVFALTVLALYVASATIYWGAFTVQESWPRALLCMLAGSAVYRLFALILYLFAVDQSWLYCVYPLISAVCFWLLARDALLSKPMSFPSKNFAQLSWITVVPTALLLLITSGLVVLLTGREVEDLPITAHVFIAFLVILGAVCLAYYVKHRLQNPSDLYVLFGIFIVIYCGALLAIYLMPKLGLGSIAIRVCLIMYLWVTLAFASYHDRIDPYLTFSIFGLLGVTLIGLRLFDYRSLFDFLVQENLLGATVAVMLFFAICVGAVLFVRSHSKDVSSAAEGEIANYEERQKKTLSSFSLTEREVEVAFLAAKGYSAKRIAEELFLSEYTVKNHLGSIYRKVGVKSKQELIKYLDTHGAN